jgi:L-ascorbate 6-phosphate lactonase
MVQYSRKSEAVQGETYIFSKNDPYNRTTSIQPVVPVLVESREYMKSIREFAVPADAIAIWYMGQNGFILRSDAGPLIGIDLYLSNSCATSFAHLPYRLDRQLPVFIEPEDLDIDVFITTHSHQDHTDPETTFSLMATRSQLRAAIPLSAFRSMTEHE